MRNLKNCSFLTVLAESTLFWTTDLSRLDSETRRDLPLTSRPTWRRSSAIWKKMTEKTKLPNSSRILTMSWKKWWANSRIFNFTLVRLYFTFTVFQNHRKSLIQRSEASYVYIMSGQKYIKNAKNCSFWRVFEKLEAFGQTVLPDMPILIGETFVVKAKITLKLNQILLK